MACPAWMDLCGGNTVCGVAG